MTLQIIVLLSSIALFLVEIYMVCGIWFRGKRSAYLKVFFAMGTIFSFWALFNGINVIVSEEVYLRFYPYTMLFVCVSPPLFFKYTLYFTDSKFNRSRLLTWLLIILPAIDIIFLLTNPLHKQFITSYTGLHPEPGIFFIYHAIISYSTLVASIILQLVYVVKNIKKSPSLFFVGVGMMLPAIFNVLYTFNFLNIGFDITPYSFVTMFIIFSVYSIKLRLFNVRETAFTSLFTSLSDSFLVIDSGGYVIDANPAFKNAFPGLELELEKTTIDYVANFLGHITLEQTPPDTLTLISTSREEVKRAEITVSPDGESYSYIISKDTITERGQYAGCIITLTDISNYRRIERMVDEINEKNTILIELKDMAESASYAKSNFLARMSHEIRTPMNAIMGMSEMMLRKELPQEIYEYTVDIRNASTNLLSIINDILDFSKIESGKMEITESVYSLPSLINDVIRIIKMRLIEKPLQFAVNIDSSIPSSLIGDEIRVRQVLTNLLSNAVKYTPEGYISLNIAGEMQGNSVLLTVTVRDSGVGIKREDLDKLFGDFVQLNKVSNKGIEGTGLGLAISKSLCQLMGGDIIAESEYGKGSVFTATLPQKISGSTPFAKVENPQPVLIYEIRNLYRDSISRTLDDLGVSYAYADTVSVFADRISSFAYVFVSSFMYENILQIIAKADPPPKLVLLTDSPESIFTKNAHVLNLPAHSLSIANVLNEVHENHSGIVEIGASFTAPDVRVLIVDDVTVNLRVAEGLMSMYEMKLDTCNSGREAIELISENEYDIVFMDHMMPEMDGLEATRIIRSMEGKYYKELPIIALTANAITGVREMFLQNEMNDFLAKPIEMTKLNSILDKWIPKSKRKSGKSGKQSSRSNESAEYVNKLRSVPWLSVDKALINAGCSPEAYKRIVKLTTRLLHENITRLESLITGDLSLYSIEVHGIKGALNNIGAYSLGDKAYELEILAKDGKQSVCESLHPTFIASLNNFISQVKDINGQAEDNSKPDGDYALIAKAIPKLRDASEYFDSVLALELLTPLFEYSYDTKTDAILRDLGSAFERFEFEEAEKLIEPLHKSIQ